MVHDLADQITCKLQIQVIVQVAVIIVYQEVKRQGRAENAWIADIRQIDLRKIERPTFPH
ncbi:hypothetical protein WT66_02500 [Burkholderia stagnalis]|nr:hypothetical protein WT18_09500 [Burkholderia stagnalis]KVP13050.1 hypothetical protein WT20_11210 [Burkholderia stagnalis]KVW96562.1 hypothetical protein WT30_12270 [Burkholderia stagnalis]KWH75685.1 hypothetical protein WT66_02500 [Burkholderia stagnalis]